MLGKRTLKDRKSFPVHSRHALLINPLTSIGSRLNHPGSGPCPCRGPHRPVNTPRSVTLLVDGTVPTTPVGGTEDQGRHEGPASTWTWSTVYRRGNRTRTPGSIPPPGSAHPTLRHRPRSTLPLLSGTLNRENHDPKYQPFPTSTPSQP